MNVCMYLRQNKYANSEILNVISNILDNSKSSLNAPGERSGKG